jgi:hypothetical protein
MVAMRRLSRCADRSVKPRRWGCDGSFGHYTAAKETLFVEAASQNSIHDKNRDGEQYEQ